jgi:hypothetical protein
MTNFLHGNKSQTTIRIQGGLGNQLFQVTSGILLLHGNARCNTMNYDFSWYHEQERRTHERIYTQLFPPLSDASKTVNPTPKLKPSILNYINKKLRKDRNWSGLIHGGIRATTRSVSSPLKNNLLLTEVLLDGDYVLTEPVVDYLKKIKMVIPKTPPTENWLNNLDNRPFCGVHVRRGDYLTHASFLTAQDYHIRAMQLIKKNFPDLLFVVHSDDLNWCKQQSHFNRKDVIFLEKDISECALSELFLLSNATAYITANSTFSWWASAFARIFNPKYEFTIMPYQWFGGDDQRLTKSLIRSDSICLRSW